MADGSVVIEVITDEKQAQNLIRMLGQVDKAASEVGGKMRKSAGDPFKEATGGAGNMVKAILGSKGVVMAMNMVKDSVGQAVSRFDTMKQYPKVMESLGHSTEASERSIRKLASGIEGLPTRLDEVVGTAQQLAGITGDINKATDLTLALNNAFLSSGSSSADAARGLQQYTQMLSSGKVDMQSWRTLNETMNLALIKTAESFGFAGASAKNDLYEALKFGSITFDEFSDRLIKLNKEVGGFADTAAEGSRGIATSFANIKTAVINGMAGIITILDENMKKMTSKDIAGALDVLKGVIKAFFSAVQFAIKATLPIFNLLFQALDALLKLAVKLEPVLIGLLAAFVAYKAITGIELVVLGFQIALMSIKGAAMAAINGLKALWATMLANPVTLVAVGIAGLIAGLIALWNTTSDATQKIIDSAEEAKKAVTSLHDSVEEGNEAWEKQKDSLELNKKSMYELADSSENLSNMQGRSAGDTKKLKDNIAELNKYIGDEVILYDEKSKKINQSAEDIKAYIDAASGQEKLTSIKERNNKLDEERMKIEAEQKVVSEELAKAEAEYSQANIWQGKKQKEAIDSLKESQNQLATDHAVNAEQHNMLEAEKQAVLDQTAAAEEHLKDKMVERGVTMRDLSEKEQKLVEDMKARYQQIEEASTDMFDKIETKSKLSTEEMIANLRHNLEAVSDWADNMDNLANRGVNEGMLEKLRAMGPAGAGYVAELNTMSDEQLQEFNDLFEEAGEKAPESLGKSMGIDTESIPNGVMGLVTQVEGTLTDAFNDNDWSKYGGNVTQGLKEGIEEGAEEVSTSSKKMGETIQESFTDEMGIHSPSVVMHDFGLNIDEGLANGINEGNNLVVEAMKALSDILNQTATQDFTAFGQESDRIFKEFAETVKTSIKEAETNALVGLRSMTNVFRTSLIDTRDITRDMMDSTVEACNITSRMRYLGASAGNGFMYGLESRSGAIIATARSIADSVASTMRRALDIHSPSRVLKKIGMQTGEGLEIGIDYKLGDIKKKSEQLAESAVPKVDQSRLFNVGKDMVQTSSVVNNSNRETNNETVNETVFNVEKIIWQGKEDIRETMQEIGWIAGQQGRRLQTT